MKKDDVYIVAACRTGIGALNGQFKETPATILGATVIKCCLQRGRISASDVSEVIMGQVFTAGQGQNPARQAAVAADIPWSTPAYTINMHGGSSLKAVYLAYQAICCKEDVKFVVCGGQENMTMAQHSAKIRNLPKLEEIAMQDTLLVDGLLDPFTGLHTGEIAGHFADVNKIMREEQDRFALHSHNRAARSVIKHVFEQETVMVQQNEYKTSLGNDELVKSNVTLCQLCEMPPIYSDKVLSNGTVTEGNSATHADGAAAVLLCNGVQIELMHLIPLARIVAFVEIGTNPAEVGAATVKAITKLLICSGWSKQEVDLFEIDETFASVIVYIIKELQLTKKKVNVAGGSIGLGQPLGANGARILVTLLHNLHRLGLSKGVAASSIGGGMAIAVSIQIP